jgi:hypothetical protein
VISDDMKNCIFSCLYGSLFVICSVLVAADKPIGVKFVPMHALIANPQKYDGLLIRTIGVPRHEYELSAIYVSIEAAQHMLPLAGFWVEMAEKKSLGYTGRYVILEGRVKLAAPPGNAGTFGSAVIIGEWKIGDSIPISQ